MLLFLIAQSNLLLFVWITFGSTSDTLLRTRTLIPDTFAGPPTGPRIAPRLEREGLYLRGLLRRGLTRWIENVIGECGL